MKTRFYYSPASDRAAGSDTIVGDATTTDDTATGDAAAGDAGTTDSSKLLVANLFISPDGGQTNEEYPVPGVAYDFVVTVANGAAASTGAFFVKFQFNPDSENPNPDADLTAKQDDGLAAGAQMQAVSHFGTFPNAHNTYHLDACVYDAAAPEQAISCTSFEFFVNTAD